MARQSKYYRVRNKYAMMKRNRAILEKRKEVIRNSVSK